MQAHERLEEVKLQAVRDNNVQLVAEILDSLNNLPEKDAATAELAKILQEPHFKVFYLLYVVVTVFNVDEQIKVI